MEESGQTVGVRVGLLVEEADMGSGRRIPPLFWSGPPRVHLFPEWRGHALIVPALNGQKRLAQAGGDGGRIQRTRRRMQRKMQHPPRDPRKWKARQMIPPP